MIEVETPLLRHFAVSDPFLDNIRVENHLAQANNTEPQWLFLQTSPEYAMKQWLAQGSGSIYQIAKAFRQDHQGRLHQPEFTLLEWYRVGFTLGELIDDVAALVNTLLPISRPTELISYRDAFVKHLAIDVFSCDIQELKTAASNIVDVNFCSEDRDTWLNLLLTHAIEPHLGVDKLTFLYDYPPSQAALAKVDRDAQGALVARRFELYIDGIEIANGYDELTDLSQFEQRFTNDNKVRREEKKPEVSLDTDFARAMDMGIPECSGVALGLDRLMLFCI